MQRSSSPFRSAARTAAALLVALTCLGACGGGGVAGPAPVTDLGILALVPATVTPWTVQNPLDAEASVTQVAALGPFAVAPSSFPATVAANDFLTLDLTFQPAGPGPSEGQVTLNFASASGSETATYRFRAVAEDVQYVVNPSSLDFGTVPPGQSAERVLTLISLSELSTVEITSAELPSADYSLPDTTFPIVLAPDDVVPVTVRYAPLGAGSQGDLVLGPNDLGAAIRVPLEADAPELGGETVTDFGSQAFDGNGRTQQLTVTVPDDAISITFESLAGSSDVLGLGELIGPQGRVYENVDLSGNYIWIPSSQIFSTTVPNTDRASVQLEGGGTYRFRMLKLSGPSGAATVRVIVEHRPAALAGVATLDLNVWLADGLDVGASGAATDARLQSILARADTILSGQGIRLGDVDYYDVTNPAFDHVTSESEFRALLQLTSAAARVRLNLFFVETALGGGVVGLSAGIGGPKRNGTPLSGVMSVYDGFSPNTIGLIAAHEIGHYQGLYHTVESTGEHDFIDDTPECPANGSGGECSSPGGGLLMHWQAVGGTHLTDGQGLVLRGHPHMAPGASGDLSKPTSARAAPSPWTQSEWLEVLSLPETWCGNCAGR